MGWYRIGTITVTAGSSAVTGAGTAFVAAVQAGHAIILPDNRLYEIAAIVSNTELTLATPYYGGTGAGQTYVIVPTRGFAQQTVDLITAFRTQYAGYATTSLAGRFGDGPATAPPITFAQDLDTGFWRPAANEIGMAVGGVEGARVTAAGLRVPLATGRAIGFGGDRITLAGGNSIARYGLTYEPFGGNSEFGVALAAYGPIYLCVSDAARWKVTNNLEPMADAVGSVGAPSRRIAVVYAETGTIATSDEREKLWRGDLTADELAAAREIAGAIGVFRFRASVDDKGEDGARLHVGVKAQQVIAIMQAHGLAPDRYAFACHDTWAGGDRYGIRYDELAMFLAAAQEQRLIALEA